MASVTNEPLGAARPRRRINNWQQLVAVMGPPVVVAFVALLTLSGIRQAAGLNHRVTHTLQVEVHVARLGRRQIEAESNERGFLLTGSDRYIKRYNAAHQAVGGEIDSLRVLTSDNPHQQFRLDTLTRVAQARLAVLDSAIADKQANNAAAALAIVARGRGAALSDTLTRLTNAMAADEERLLTERTAAARRQRELTIALLVIGTVVAVLVGLIVNGLLTRYAAAQAAAREQLDVQNASLQEQALELESQADQLQQQAAELEAANEQLDTQNTSLQQQAVEMESQADQLQQQATELEASNEQLAAAHDASEAARTIAEEANRAKAQFLTTMSHELRTPLNAITGYTELLAAGVRGTISAEQSEDLARIRRAGTHLMGLINDVLNFAKLEAAQVRFEQSTVSVHDTLAAAAVMIDPQATAKQLTFTHVACDPNIAVRGDREKVIQIVLNLLSNAVKFTPAGGRVTLTCDAGHDPVAIAVEDTGRGIPEQQLSRVFEPFVQVGRRLSGNDDGTGLGLAISRELARGMGGELTAKSTAGQGSLFVLKLARAAPGSAVEDAPRAAEAATDSSP